MLELAGYEADDIIATLATEAKGRGDDVLIVTGDRDSYQLVEDPHVRVLYNRRGVSDYALYDEAGIVERTGVTPAQYVEYAALRGDPSDNLPGVPGVGEKTAAKLITTYGGIDGIYENLDAQTPKLRQNLAENEAQVRQNAEIMVLLRDVPVTVDPDDLVVGNFDLDEVRQLFDFLEFRTLYDRLLEALGAVDESAAAAERPRGRRARGRALRPARPPPRPRAACGPWPRATPRWPSPPPGPGAEGRSPLEGLALVTDAATGEVAWIPVATLAAPEVVGRAGRARRPRWPAARRPRRQGADAQPRRARRRRPLARGSTP